MTYPPTGFDELVTAFGDPRPYVDRKAEWESHALDYFDLPYPLSFLGSPVRRIRAHREVGLLFILAFQRLQKYNLDAKATEYGGIYNFRAKRGATKLSTHVWGIALDLNPSTNPQGGESTQDTSVVTIFKDLGFEWGGDWESTPDPMHFQFCRGY